MKKEIYSCLVQLSIIFCMNPLLFVPTMQRLREWINCFVKFANRLDDVDVLFTSMDKVQYNQHWAQTLLPFIGSLNSTEFSERYPSIMSEALSTCILIFQLILRRLWGSNWPLNRMLCIENEFAETKSRAVCFAKFGPPRRANQNSPFILVRRYISDSSER